MNRLDVVSEALRRLEPYFAVSTFEGLLAVVNLLMSLQLRFIIKCLRTMGTQKVADFQMDPFDVQFQATSCPERWSIRSLGTFLAKKWLLDSVHVVHVTPKLNVLIKDFATNSTFNAQLSRCGASRFDVVDSVMVTARTGARCGNARNVILIVIVSISVRRSIAKRVVRRF